MITNDCQKILEWKQDNTVSKLKLSLLHDNISIVSTDTILGLLGSLTQRSFDKLNSIKGRSLEKKYLIVIGSLEKALKFVQYETVSDDVANMLAHCWPGEVTVIFKANPLVPSFLCSDIGTIALRCPNHKGLKFLLHDINGLFSTSVNISGQKVAYQIDDISDAIARQIDYIVVDGLESNVRVRHSTIIDVSQEKGTGVIRVVRQGAFPIERLARMYRGKFKD